MLTFRSFSGRARKVQPMEFALHSKDIPIYCGWRVLMILMNLSILGK